MKTSFAPTWSSGTCLISCWSTSQNVKYNLLLFNRINLCFIFLDVYKCPYPQCGEKFADRSAYIVHKSREHNDSDYTCFMLFSL